MNAVSSAFFFFLKRGCVLIKPLIKKVYFNNNIFLFLNTKKIKIKIKMAYDSQSPSPEPPSLLKAVQPLKGQPVTAKIALIYTNGEDENNDFSGAEEEEEEDMDLDIDLPLLSHLHGNENGHTNNDNDNNNNNNSSSNNVKREDWKSEDDKTKTMDENERAQSPSPEWGRSPPPPPQHFLSAKGHDKKKPKSRWDVSNMMYLSLSEKEKKAATYPSSLHAISTSDDLVMIDKAYPNSDTTPSLYHPKQHRAQIDPAL
ncbi:myb domain-containing protein, partial [Reticulomyxa filosa]